MTRPRRRPEPVVEDVDMSDPFVLVYRERAEAGDEWAARHLESLFEGRCNLATFRALSVLDPRFSEFRSRMEPR